jgi:hypothetical protein
MLAVSNLKYKKLQTITLGLSYAAIESHPFRDISCSCFGENEREVFYIQKYVNSYLLPKCNQFLQKVQKNQNINVTKKWRW